MYKMEVPGPPTCLSLFYNDGGDQVENKIRILISLENLRLFEGR